MTTTAREFVTSLARAVLALSGQSKWYPASASLPQLPCSSYQAPISAAEDYQQAERALAAARERLRLVIH